LRIVKYSNKGTNKKLTLPNCKPIIFKKNFTSNCQTSGTQQSSVKPRKSTIEFLKQFARAYTYQQQMPYQLGGFIAN